MNLALGDQVGAVGEHLVSPAPCARERCRGGTVREDDTHDGRHAGRDHQGSQPHRVLSLVPMIRQPRAAAIMRSMQASFGLEFTTTVLVIIAIACVVALVLIVVAPWRRVREEPPLDPDVQTRLLLHRPNPEEETGEMPTAR